MIPKLLRVKNYASYIDETLEFKDMPNLAAVIGMNGAGKSSFFVDSITTVLFNRARGTSTQGTGLENLIKTGEDELEIEFVFDSDGQEIKVIRRRFLKGGQELELYINGVSHTDKIKETQAKLESIIKIDYETFFDTVCIGQGESGKYMKKPPNERKEVFTQILGLDKYDVLQEYTKEMRREINSEIKSKKEKIEELSDSIKLKDHYDNEIIQGQAEIRRLDADISIKEVELENELAEKATYDQLVKSRNEILNKQNSLRTKVASIEDSIKKGTTIKSQYEQTILSKDEVLKSIGKYTEDLETAQAQFTTFNSEKSSLEGTNKVLTEQAKELKAKYTRLKEYNEAECGLCGQEITEEHKSRHLGDIETEAKKLIIEINVNKQKIEEFSSHLSGLTTIISDSRSKLQNLQSKKSEIDQAETKLSNIESRLEELNGELATYQKEYNEAMLQVVDDIENKTFNDGALRMQLQSLRSSQTSWQSKVAVAKNELSKIDKNEDKILQIENEIKELTEKYALLDELVTAWGKEGIQAIIIDNALPEIQDEINDFLEILTDGKVNVEFITQKEKGKGKKASSIETLDIIINDENGSRTYETYSGGERFRVDFSCHVGLAKFLAKRAGAAIDFFIVDEGIGSQDDVAKDHFVVAVNKLTTIFNKVIVITHIPDIIESFPNKIEVYKDPVNGSKIRMIN